MASVFTFETGPASLASPWPPNNRKLGHNWPAYSNEEAPKKLAGLEAPLPEALMDYGSLKLEAEPQEGPVEYKLHLLLRPRRTFSSTSTVQRVSGSYLSKLRSPLPSSGSRSLSGTSSPALAPSAQSRQNRLQHLTTQLLWRLQQSSPHHGSSKSELVMPVLPEADIELSSLREPRELVAGLEESLGALYEIGVSDDGTFVGLTWDELEESLHVLCAMGHSLGCILHVLKTVEVGDCRWEEESSQDARRYVTEYQEKLWVAEVLVAPQMRSDNLIAHKQAHETSNDKEIAETHDDVLTTSDCGSEQLRVSLTGSTTSGKSSLLGTLTTSTLDNGRGKSRLSLLRHRHEIVSGVTSSLAQELIGHQRILQASGTGTPATNVVNYASDNVSSWTDIHDASDLTRLIFFTDSAGHPKFRRTTARGLISWAPHWTLCCVAADDDEDSAGRIGATASSGDVLGAAGHAIDLSKAHLDLCLKLDLPLVVVITKLDLASKQGLRQTVAKVLSTIKASGRKPAVLPVTSSSAGITESQRISPADEKAVQSIVESVSHDQLHALVPIVLTSAVTGAGIGLVHSLLRQLPFVHTNLTSRLDSGPEEQRESQASIVFHIDEIFAVTAVHKGYSAPGTNAPPCFILSGYLRRGTLQTGDSLLLGPFSSESTFNAPDTALTHRSKSFPGLSKSLPQDLNAHSKSPRRSAVDFEKDARQCASTQPNNSSVWQTVQVTSVRYLRLPTKHLTRGQVGTVAISSTNTLYLNAEPCVRRGMVLCKSSVADRPPPAYASITAVFADSNLYVNPGSSVTVYTASIRTSAKIIEVKIPDRPLAEGVLSTADVFAFDDKEDFNGDDVDAQTDAQDFTPVLEEIEITFRFINSREWVELGTKVLVTPASGISMLSPPSRAGNGEAASSSGAIAALDGFVGRIVAAGE